MSDEFLYRLREPPRPEFAEELKARISRLSHRRGPTSHTFLVGLTLFLMVIITACAIPQARIPIIQGITQLTGHLEGTPRIIIVSMDTDVNKLQEIVPFPVHIPTWLPEELRSAKKGARVIKPQEIGFWMVTISWQMPDGVIPLHLDVWPPDMIVKYRGDEEFPVQVNGKPVTLVVKRGEVSFLQLQWVDEEDRTTYILTALEGRISRETLLKIAATIR